MSVTVQQTKLSASGTPFSDGNEQVIFDVAVPVGSFVVVGISLTASNRTISSVQDDGSVSNTYAVLSQGGVDANHEIAGTAEVWLFGAQIVNAITRVTVTVSSALGSPATMWIQEIRGQHGTTPVEDVAKQLTTPDGVSHTSGNVVTANAGSLLIGIGYGTSGVYSNPSPWTQIQNTSLGIASWRAIDAATAAYAYTSAAAEAQAVVCVAIQPAAGGGSTDATGTASGVATVAGVGASLASTTGTVTGVATAAGAGASLAAATGTANGRATVNGITPGGGGTTTEPGNLSTLINQEIRSRRAADPTLTATEAKLLIIAEARAAFPDATVNSALAQFL